MMKDDKLHRLLNSMDLPEYRIGTLNKNNLTWLSKNLKFRNSEHTSYEVVQNEIDRRLGDKEYDS